MVSYGLREERLADTVNQGGVSWRKRVFTIITGGGGSRRVIYRYPFELEEVDSFSTLPGQTRGEEGREGGIDETEVGIYVLYVYRSGSITDTREILTQDGIPPPINFPLMNGDGINKWLRAFRLSFPYDFRYGILDLGQRR